MENRKKYTDCIESWLISMQRMNLTVKMISIFAVYECLASQSAE